MSRPRILVTGFTPFPGAPVNPTERLIQSLRAHPQWLEKLGEIALEVLPVEYASVPALLEAAGRDFAPDIAVHFGLSARASGFTLERLARNANAVARVDNAGALPPPAIFDGEADLPSTLPLEAMAAALEGQGLPVAWSDDAGGYLCNYTFYLACSPRFAGYSPAMAGFIHVPPLVDADPGHPHAMSVETLAAGARVILETCAQQWATQNEKARRMAGPLEAG
jgi:pyroglutamyl-peptidase